MLQGFLADSEPHDVYNLTVDGSHEFYANGILVHNCDAGRYLLINLGGGPDWTILDEEKPSEIAEALGPYQPMGAYAYVPMADEPDWFAGEDDIVRRTVRTAEP